MKHVLINKLDNIESNKNDFDDWSLKDQLELLEIYSIICKKETLIFNLIYKYHSCDSWEDIFRDYDLKYLEDKAEGVEVAINKIYDKISEEKKLQN